jgi:hypothetical protein
LVGHTCNPNTWEVESGGLQVQGQPWLCIETLSKKINESIWFQSPYWGDTENLCIHQREFNKLWQCTESHACCHDFSLQDFSHLNIILLSFKEYLINKIEKIVTYVTYSNVFGVWIFGYINYILCLHMLYIHNIMYRVCKCF